MAPVLPERSRLSSTVCESPILHDEHVQKEPEIENIHQSGIDARPFETPPPPAFNQDILPHIEPHPCVTPPPPESNQSFLLPEEIRPFPKAAPRLGGRRNILKRKSTIYTDTPEKENLLENKMI